MESVLHSIGCDQAPAGCYDPVVTPTHDRFDPSRARHRVSKCDVPDTCRPLQYRCAPGYGPSRPALNRFRFSLRHGDGTGYGFVFSRVRRYRRFREDDFLGFDRMRAGDVPFVSRGREFALACFTARLTACGGRGLCIRCFRYYLLIDFYRGALWQGNLLEWC